MPLIFYKLGGSLLTLPDLDSRLMVLFRQPLPAPLAVTADGPLARAVLVGGGRTADVVREWDRHHRLGNQRSHDLAVAAMGLNARLVKSLLPAAEWATKRNSIARLRAGGRVAVLDPQAVLDEAERRATARLPRSWDVTSDSLAAFLATEWGAAALVLVKSKPRPAGKSLREAARRVWSTNISQSCAADSVRRVDQPAPGSPASNAGFDRKFSSGATSRSPRCSFDTVLARRVLVARLGEPALNYRHGKAFSVVQGRLVVHLHAVRELLHG